MVRVVTLFLDDNPNPLICEESMVGVFAAKGWKEKQNLSRTDPRGRAGYEAPIVAPIKDSQPFDTEEKQILESALPPSPPPGLQLSAQDKKAADFDSMTKEEIDNLHIELLSRCTRDQLFRYCKMTGIKTPGYRDSTRESIWDCIKRAKGIE